MSLKILDCTLRDGGYYSSWHFKQDVIENYLNSISKSNVDIVELGLRVCSSKEFLGPFAYTTDEYLSTLNLPSGPEYAIMINLSEYLNEDKSPKTENLESNFNQKKDSAVSVVRIAAHFNDLEYIQPVVQNLSKKGYRIIVNIMQIANYSADAISEKVKELDNVKEIEVLYFADSLGSMTASKISKMVKTLKSSWNRELGIHAHDNMGFAISNSLEANRLGVSHLDGTILGMGRGAGNAQMERLLIEIKKINNGAEKYHPEALFKIVLDDFQKLKDEHCWGSSLLYHLSAHYNIHPSYIQELMTKGESSDSEFLINSIEQLRDLTKSTSFSKSNLVNIGKPKLKSSGGSWNPSTSFEGKEVLIIGSGKGVRDNILGIKNFIKRKNPIVVSLNINNYIEPSFINYYIACHPLRVVSQAPKYKGLNTPVIVPINSFSDKVQEEVSHIPHHNFGIKIEDTELEYAETYCKLRSPLAMGYTLSLLGAGKASKAYLAGFDGYGDHDPKQKEMNRIFEEFSNKNKTLDILAVTPTTYSIERTSIYNPRL